MNSNNPTLSQTINLVHSSKTYRTTLNRLPRSSIYHYDDHAATVAYWEQLSKYLISRCPYCGSELSEKVDLYSLKFWRRKPGQSQYAFADKFQLGKCDHFVAVQCFVNLNGTYYEENEQPNLPAFVNHNGDIPFIIPDLLPDHIPSTAVIHSLPICNIESGQFIPRFSVYMITYYSESPPEIISYRYKILDPGEDDYLVLLGFPELMRVYPILADLSSWVERGKLQWIDIQSQQLCSEFWANSDFPYANIQGFGKGFIYRPSPIKVPFWNFWRNRNLREDGRIELKQGIRQLSSLDRAVRKRLAKADV